MSFFSGDFMFSLIKNLIFSIAQATNGDDRSSFMDWFRGQVCPGVDPTSRPSITQCLTQQLNLADIVVLLNLLIRFVLAFAGIIAVLYLIWAGYSFMISVGNPDRLAEAKLKLVWTIVGLILIIMAYLIVHYLFEAFGPPGINYNPFA